jgi:hypothetical protein
MPLLSDPPLDLVTPVQVATRSKAWVCGCSLTGIVGSNPRRGHGCLLCVVRYMSLRRANPSYGGILPNVVCLSVISIPQQRGGLGPTGAVVSEEKVSCIKNRNHDCCHYTFLCIPCHLLPLRPTIFSISLLCSTLRTGMLFVVCMPMPCVRARATDMTALMTLRVGLLSLLQPLLTPPILKCPVTCMRASETLMPLCHVMSSPELERSASAVYHQFV